MSELLTEIKAYLIKRERELTLDCYISVFPQDKLEEVRELIAKIDQEAR